MKNLQIVLTFEMHATHNNFSGRMTPVLILNISILVELSSALWWLRYDECDNHNL